MLSCWICSPESEGRSVLRSSHHYFRVRGDRERACFLYCFCLKGKQEINHKLVSLNRTTNKESKLMFSIIKVIGYQVSSGKSFVLRQPWSQDFHSAVICRWHLPYVVTSLRSNQLKIPLTSEINGVRMWDWDNKLSLNPADFNLLIITPKLDSPSLSICIQCTDGIIKSVNKAKYLGILLAVKLSFSDHIKVLENTVRLLHLWEF